METWNRYVCYIGVVIIMPEYIDHYIFQFIRYHSLENMKKTKDLFYSFYKITLILMLPVALFSCKKNSDHQRPLSDGKALVRIRVTNTSFIAGGDIDQMPTTKSNTSAASQALKNRQTDTMDWDNEFMLVAELVPDRKASSTKILTKSTNIIAPNIKYAVHVFNNEGQYVDSRLYSMGREHETSELKLDVDKQYTFIALSINTETSFSGGLTFTNNIRTLSNATFSVSSSDDLMYYQKVLKVTGENENYLDINFNHSFSQITTTIDASSTLQPINSISLPYLRPNHTGNTIFHLANSTIERDNKPLAVRYFSFTGLNTPVIRSTATIVNVPSNEIFTFTIGSITIGTRMRTNLFFSNNFRVEPGTANSLRLTLERKDRYGGYIADRNSTIPTVRINGQIWMRQNVDLNKTNRNQYSHTLGQSLNGQYYQWGSSLPRATATAIATAPTLSTYFQNNPQPQAGTNWNQHNTNTVEGRSFAPDRAHDPCPYGFRVPTVSEVNELFRNVTVRWEGESLVLTSNQNNDIKMIIPGQGYFAKNDNNSSIYHPRIENKVVAAFWLTHDGDGTNPYFISRQSEGTWGPVSLNSEQARRFLFPVRCIKH